MNLLTHLDISLKLKKVIEQNYTIKLNTLRFMFGNIKPDLFPWLFQTPHFKKNADSFVRQQIGKILNEKIQNNSKCNGKFSERLGVLTHYLSDFFCFAHSDAFTDGLLVHNIYEFGLTLMTMKNSVLLKKTLLDSRIPIHQNVFSIYRHLDELHQNYSRIRRNATPLEDMVYALSACKCLCFSVIASCVTDISAPPFTQFAAECLRGVSTRYIAEMDDLMLNRYVTGYDHLTLTYSASESEDITVIQEVFI